MLEVDDVILNCTKMLVQWHPINENGLCKANLKCYLLNNDETIAFLLLASVRLNKFCISHSASCKMSF